jgi:hypothetical protein
MQKTDGSTWCPPVIEPISVYGSAVEARSVAELEALSEEGIKFQAQLVRERVLGPAHSVSLESLAEISNYYKKRGDVVRCIQLQQHSLDIAQHHLKPFESRTLILGFDPLIQTFTELVMAKLMSEGTQTRNAEQSEQMFAQMFVVLEKAVLELERAKTKDSLPGQCVADHDHLMRIVQLIVLLEWMTHSQPDSAAGLQRLKSALQDGVMRINPQDASQGETLLHVACDQWLYKPSVPPGTFIDWHQNYHDFEVLNRCRIPNPAFFNVTLDVGMETNTVDTQGNTPLHLAAKQLLVALKGTHETGQNRRPHEDLTVCSNVAEMMKVLVRRGAHLDARNAEGHTALELLAAESQLGASKLGAKWLEDIFGAKTSSAAI